MFLLRILLLYLKIFGLFINLFRILEKLDLVPFL